MNADGGDIRFQRPDCRETERRRGTPVKPILRPWRGPSSAQTRGQSVEAFTLLPSAHAVGHTFVKVGRPDDGLYAREPQPLSDFVAHSGKGEGDPLALQLFDRVQ